MDVAFIAAMEEELTALKQCLTPREETAAFLGDLPVFAGNLQGYDVVVVQCGIGKVNAALAPSTPSIASNLRRSSPLG